MKTISFFSYKGGSGRTSLLYNTLPFLVKELKATPDEPIVVLDLDIDSKGLTYLFDSDSNINSFQILKGDISDDIISRSDCLSRIGMKIGLDYQDNGSVLFASANPNKYYSSLGYDNNYDGQNISLYPFESICFNSNCKAIIIDTPAGNQLSGDAALKISNKIVTVMRITKQFRNGTFEFLNEKSKKFNDKEFIIVPNVVPNFDNTDYDIEKYIKIIKTNSNDSITGNNMNNLTMLKDNELGINEVNLLKFEEKILANIEKPTPDELLAINKYKVLAKELAKWKMLLIKYQK